MQFNVALTNSLMAFDSHIFIPKNQEQNLMVMVNFLDSYGCSDSLLSDDADKRGDLFHNSVNTIMAPFMKRGSRKKNMNMNHNQP